MSRGAAALAERLHVVRPRVCPSSEPHTPTARRHTDDALAILGDRGLFLPDGLDALAAKVAALKPWRYLHDGGTETFIDRAAVLALIAKATE